VAGASTTRYYIGECKGVSEVHASPASRLSVGWPKFTERHDIEILLCSRGVRYLGRYWTPAVARIYMAAHAAIWKAAEVFTALGFVITLVVATEALVVGEGSEYHGVRETNGKGRLPISNP
jgi:hypothetical protein